MNCFSGTAAPVLKALHYFFYCFLKIKELMHFQFHNIAIGNNQAVPLGHRGPLRVMLFIYSRLHFRLYETEYFH